MRKLVAAAAAALAFLLPGSPASARASAAEQVVRGFLSEVRSGRNPEAASRYFVPRVAPIR
jgi:hypothetical protein